GVPQRMQNWDCAGISEAHLMHFKVVTSKKPKTSKKLECFDRIQGSHVQVFRKDCHRGSVPNTRIPAYLNTRVIGRTLHAKYTTAASPCQTASKLPAILITCV